MLLFNAPLHTLRKRKFFQSLLKSRWNRPTLYSLGFSHRVALRPLTHASIRLKKQHLEPGIRVLITWLVQKLDEHKDEGWFFDVGANVGLYVWEVAKACAFSAVLQRLESHLGQTPFEMLGERVDDFISKQLTLAHATAVPTVAAPVQPTNQQSASPRACPQPLVRSPMQRLP